MYICPKCQKEMIIVRHFYLFHCGDCFITYELIDHENQTGSLYTNDFDPTAVNFPFYRGTFDTCCRIYKLKSFL